MGLAGPGSLDPEPWKTLLEDRRPDVQELRRLLTAWMSAPGYVLHGIAQAYHSGSLTLDLLVPQEPVYYEALLGERPGAMAREAYVTTRLIPHMRRLLSQDLTKGLPLVLSMAVTAGLYAAPLLDEIDDAQLRAALEACAPWPDPLSRLNVFDLALHRAERDPWFMALASSLGESLMVRACCECSDVDSSHFFRVLLRFVTGKVRELPTLAAQPVYYQRLCAWVHTAQLMRILSAGHLSELLSVLEFEVENKGLNFALLSDVVRAPLSMEHRLDWMDVDAYVVGRVLERKTSYSAVALETSGLQARLEAQVASITEQGRYLNLWQADPLQLEELPQPLTLPVDADVAHFMDLLRQFIHERSDNPGWSSLDAACHVMAFTPKLQEEIEATVSLMEPFKATPEAAEMQGIAHIAHIACIFGRPGLVEAVLQLCRSLLSVLLEPQTGLVVLSSAYIACAGFRSNGQAHARLGRYLAEVVPAASPEMRWVIRYFVFRLEAVLPIEERHFGRAKALLECRPMKAPLGRDPAKGHGLGQDPSSVSPS